MIELLLGHGASINAKTAKEGSTPLHLAAKTSDCLKCLIMLISSGARINEVQNVSLDRGKLFAMKKRNLLRDETIQKSMQFLF